MTPVLWLFGLPCAGKTTLANALRDRLIAQGKPAVVLDGDELRKGPCKDLGFSDEDRAENLRRAAGMALAEGEKGALVIGAFVTPKDRHRALVREILGEKLRLIHVDCPQEVCAQRDVKGLYAKARNGEMQGLTGPQDPFERPKNADLRVPTAQLPLEECVERVLERFGLGVTVASAGRAKTEPSPTQSPGETLKAELVAVTGAPAMPLAPPLNPQINPEPMRRHRRPLTLWRRCSIALVGGVVVVSFITAIVMAWVHLSQEKPQTQVRVKRETPPPPGPQPAFPAVSPAPPVTPVPLPQTIPPPQGIPMKTAQTVAPVLAEFKDYTPDGQPVILQAAQELMTAYWKAETWQEKLAFVRDRGRVGPLMRSHYEVRRAGEPPAGPMRSSQFQRVGGHELLRLAFKREDKPNEPFTHAPLLRQPDGAWLLDWEAFAGACEMDWPDFIAQRRTQPTLFRAFATKGDYYNYEFTDEANLLCLRLESWDGRHHLHAYCKPDGETGERVRTFQLANGRGASRVCVRLAFPENAKSGECVRLTEFIADRWLLLGSEQ